MGMRKQLLSMMFPTALRALFPAEHRDLIRATVPVKALSVIEPVEQDRPACRMFTGKAA
jgi:hypothetical protein